MKKKACLFLTLVLLLTQGITFITVSAATEVTISDAYASVMPGGQGVGYFDSNINSSTLEKYLGYLFLRSNDWVKYDLTSYGLEAGTYSVTVSVAAKSGNTSHVLDLLVDDKLSAKSSPYQCNTTDWASPVWNDLTIGNVYLSAGAHTLTLLQGSKENIRSKQINLTRVNEGDITTGVFRFLPMNAAVYTDNAGVASIRLNEEYYDSTSYAFDHVAFATTTNVLLHGTANEWLKYNIEGLPGGVYEVVINYGSQYGMKPYVSIDGVDKVKGKTIPTTPNNSTPTTTSLGQISIPSGSTRLKFKATNQATQLYYLELRYVAPYRTETSHTFEAEDVMSIDGVSSFFDAQAGDPSPAPTIEPGHTSPLSILMRAGDWQHYDITLLKPAFYTVKAVGSSQYGATLNLSIDDGGVALSKAFGTTTNYTTYDTRTLGIIQIGNGNETIKVTSNTGSQALYFDKFILEEIPYYAKYTSDSAGADEITTLPPSGGTIYATASVVNSAYAGGLTFFAATAVYTGDELKSLVVNSDTLAMGTPAWNGTYPVTVAAGDTVKTFIWEANALSPLLLESTVIQ